MGFFFLSRYSYLQCPGHYITSQWMAGTKGLVNSSLVLRYRRKNNPTHSLQHTSSYGGNSRQARLRVSNGSLSSTRLVNYKTKGGYFITPYSLLPNTTAPHIKFTSITRAIYRPTLQGNTSRAKWLLFLWPISNCVDIKIPLMRFRKW